MVQFHKSKRKNLSFTYLLLAVAVLEFIGLAGVLISDSRARINASSIQPAQIAQEISDDEIMPAWLEPAEEQIVEKQKPEGESTGPEILSHEQIIAHALGMVEEGQVLNCLEGFEQMYAQGVRAFEADLRLTSDQKVILRHDWRRGWQDGVGEASVPTLEEFKNLPVMGKYTPLSFQDLLLLMEEYPDICIVTDTKFIEPEFVRLQFDAMLQDAADLGLSYLLDRLVVQVYTPLMFEAVDSIHHFEGYIYTFYLEGFDGTEETFRERAEYCVENGIMGVAMVDQLWKPAFTAIAEEYGLLVYTHTVNDLDQTLSMLDGGLSGVYTDLLTPGSLEPEETPEEPEAESEQAADPAGNDTEGETESWT